MKKIILLLVMMVGIFSGKVFSHCQMPCGIYHDDMVYDQIDQYVETMYKGVTVMNNSKFTSDKERNEFIRWVINKEKASDEVAQILTTYFLQQKIKPDEEDTAKRLESAHKLLFLLVAIKQNANRNMVEEFADEWEKFKLMFHVEGYECQIEALKHRKREQAQEKMKQQQQQNGNGKQPEGNARPVAAPTNGARANSASSNNPWIHNHDHDHTHGDHDHDHDHPHVH